VPVAYDLAGLVQRRLGRLRSVLATGDEGHAGSRDEPEEISHLSSGFSWRTRSGRVDLVDEQDPVVGKLGWLAGGSNGVD
jgi:hypothetical protein